MTNQANHIELWDAINAYAEACGGDTSNQTVSSRRMQAVARIEQAVRSTCVGSISGVEKLTGSVYIARRHDGWAAYMEPATALKTPTLGELLEQMASTQQDTNLTLIEEWAKE